VGPEQVRETDGGAPLVAELVIALDLAARRKRPALSGDPLNVAAKLDLLFEEGGARRPILGAVVGIGPARLGGENGGGLEFGHVRLLKV
jgi:hypothetical protein